MPQFHLRCMYCGHQFAEYVFSIEGANSVKCPVCGDSHLKDESQYEEKKDVFGYNYKEKK